MDQKNEFVRMGILLNKFKMIFECALVGIFTGIIIGFFRIFINKSSFLLSTVYKGLFRNNFLIIPWILVLAAIGYIISKMIEREPLLSSSLPKFLSHILSYFVNDEAAFKGNVLPKGKYISLKKLDFKWFRVVFGKFFGSIICIGSGLSLGIEGPSAQIGIAIGQATSRLFKKNRAKEKFLIISGAGAGISGAFSAPLAGMMFAVEKVHGDFSSFTLLLAFSAAVCSDLVVNKIFKMKFLLGFKNLSVIPVRMYAYLVALGIVLGFMAVLFNRTLIKVQNYFRRKNGIKKEYKIIFIFLLTIFGGFFVPQVLGGGASILNLLSSGDFTFKFIIILLVLKFLYTILCYGSGVPGGVFVPILALGALIGGIYGMFLQGVFGTGNIYINTFIVLGMAGYFASSVRAPLTASVLILEMTGSFSLTVSVGLVSLISYSLIYAADAHFIKLIRKNIFLVKRKSAVNQ